jgi:hypothetical protein
LLFSQRKENGSRPVFASKQQEQKTALLSLPPPPPFTISSPNKTNKKKWLGSTKQKKEV